MCVGLCSLYVHIHLCHIYANVCSLYRYEIFVCMNVCIYVWMGGCKGGCGSVCVCEICSLINVLRMNEPNP